MAAYKQHFFSNIFPIMYRTVHLGTATAASELHSTKALTC